MELTDERDSLRAENQVIGEHVFGLQKDHGWNRNPQPQPDTFSKLFICLMTSFS